MTPETLTALKASIAKWDVHGRRRDIAYVDLGPKTCPLCLLFHPDIGSRAHVESCDGCPVKHLTRRPGCRGTPYCDAEDALDEDDSKTFRAKARAEAAFLRSLLPEGETA